MENDLTRSRFVILHHQVGPSLTRTDQSHFDWMFDLGGTLRTWSTAPLVGWTEEIEIGCDLLCDHRISYLDYEGEMDGDRGRVTRVLRGVYGLTDDRIDRFAAELFWEQGATARTATVTCYRSLPAAGSPVDESRWRLCFSPGR